MRQTMKAIVCNTHGSFEFFASGISIRRGRCWSVWDSLISCSAHSCLPVSSGRRSLPPSPGFSLDYIDWSHSLVMSVVWSIVFAAAFARYGRRVMVALGFAVFSHFLLDVPMHPPDLAGSDLAARIQLALAVPALM